MFRAKLNISSFYRSFTSKIFKGSKYGEGHPLNIDRVWPSLELLKKMKWINEDEIIFNDIASVDDLLLFHDENYLKALQYAEEHQTLPHHLKLKYKIGIGNNPIFKEVFSRPASSANSSMNAVEYLYKGNADKVLNFSGGTHHGRSSFASGFCFLNDCILAIIKAINLGFKKILYVDIDEPCMLIGRTRSISCGDEPRVQSRPLQRLPDQRGSVRHLQPRDR